MDYWESQAKADALLKKKEYRESLRYYSQALASVPNVPQRSFAVISIYLGKVQSYLGMDEPEKAMRTLHELHKDDISGI